MDLFRKSETPKATASRIRLGDGVVRSDSIASESASNRGPIFPAEESPVRLPGTRECVEERLLREALAEEPAAPASVSGPVPGDEAQLLYLPPGPSGRPNLVVCILSGCGFGSEEARVALSGTTLWVFQAGRILTRAEGVPRESAIRVRSFRTATVVDVDEDGGFGIPVGAIVANERETAALLSRFGVS